MEFILIPVYDYDKDKKTYKMNNSIISLEKQDILRMDDLPENPILNNNTGCMITLSDKYVKTFIYTSLSYSDVMELLTNNNYNDNQENIEQSNHTMQMESNGHNLGKIDVTIRYYKGFKND